MHARMRKWKSEIRGEFQQLRDEGTFREIAEKVMCVAALLDDSLPPPRGVGVSSDHSGYISWACTVTGVWVEIHIEEDHPATMHIGHIDSDQLDYVGPYDALSTDYMNEYIHLTAVPEGGAKWH